MNIAKKKIVGYIDAKKNVFVVLEDNRGILTTPKEVKIEKDTKVIELLKKYKPAFLVKT